VRGKDTWGTKHLQPIVVNDWGINSLRLSTTVSLYRRNGKDANELSECETLV